MTSSLHPQARRALTRDYKQAFPAMGIYAVRCDAADLVVYLLQAWQQLPGAEVTECVGGVFTVEKGHDGGMGGAGQCHCGGLRRWRRECCGVPLPGR